MFREIAFWHLQICYLIFFDWKRQPARVPLQNPESKSKLVCLVGGSLIAAVVLTSIFNIASWPFAAYPPFQSKASDRETRLEIAALDGEGNTIPIRPETTKFTHVQFARIGDRILKGGDKSEKKVLARALFKVQGIAILHYKPRTKCRYTKLPDW